MLTSACCGCSVQQQFAEVQEEAARRVARLTESFEADRARLNEKLLEALRAKEELKVTPRLGRSFSHTQPCRQNELKFEKCAHEKTRLNLEAEVGRRA